MIFALAVLLLFQCLAEGISYVFRLRVPGPLLGMLLLLAYLVSRPKFVDAVEPIALELLRHLSLLFVPAGVGIMVSASTLNGEWIAAVVSIIVSTTLGIASAKASAHTRAERSTTYT